MKTRFRRWAWPLTKALLALAILAAVARQFHGDLRRLDVDDFEVRWPFVLLSALLYLAGLACWAAYWLRLLVIFKQKPSGWRAYRAYFISQLGKYVPGKALALLLRGSFSADADVRAGVAILTAFYEVLTSMAAGALLAAVIFIIRPPEVPGIAWHPLYTGLLLLGLVGVPLLPGVFNLLMERLARKFPLIDSYQVPRMRGSILAQGLLITGCGWLFLGAALWAMLAAILPEPPAFTPGVWAHCTATLGLAFVAGFLAVVLPAGVGAREYFLRPLLAPAGPIELVVTAILVARLTWTSAELVVAGVLYFLPGSKHAGHLHSPVTANAPRAPKEGVV